MSDLAQRRKSAVGAFEMARRETAKAWNTTALLSMVRQERVAGVIESLKGSDAKAKAKTLIEIAGPSFDAYCVKHGLDGGRFVKASEIIVGLLCRDLPAVVAPSEALVAMDTLFQAAAQWIELGELPESKGASDLKKIAELMGAEPEARLALLAPLSPAIASVEFVLRAADQQYPFASARAQERA